MLNDTGALKLDSQEYLESTPRTWHSNSPSTSSAYNGRSQHYHRNAAIDIDRTVDIAPREIATRRAKRADGLGAEIVQTIRQERIDIRFRAPVSLLVIV